MTDGTRVLTDALIEARVGSAVADEVAVAIDRRRLLEAGSLAGVRAEVARLRLLVQAQAGEIADLRQRLADAEAAGHELPVEDLLRAVAGSVAAGAATLDGYAVSHARVEVRTSLAVSSAGLRVRSSDPALADSASLGTVAMEVGALPPTPGQEAVARAVADLVSAAAVLQAALDRDFPAIARDAGRSALARASVLAATPVSAARGAVPVTAPLVELVTSLQALAGPLPALAGPVAALAARQRALPATVTDPAAVEGVTSALRDLAAAVDRLPR